MKINVNGVTLVGSFLNIGDTYLFDIDCIEKIQLCEPAMHDQPANHSHLKLVKGDEYFCILIQQHVQHPELLVYDNQDTRREVMDDIMNILEIHAS